MGDMRRGGQRLRPGSVEWSASGEDGRASLTGSRPPRPEHAASGTLAQELFGEPVAATQGRESELRYVPSAFDIPRPDATDMPDAGSYQPLAPRRTSHSAAVYRRRRIMVGIAALVVIALIVLLASAVWRNLASASGPAAPTAAASPTVATSPTVIATTATVPTITPIARDPAASAFGKALPSAVGRYALTAEESTYDWGSLNAGEAYKLAYATGTGPDASVINVVAGQWGSASEAIAARTSLVPPGVTPTASGNVKVGGDVVGDWLIVPGTDGNATITWRNTTVVIQATGPAAEMEDFFRAFPL